MKKNKFLLFIICLVFSLNVIFLNCSFATLYILKDQEGKDIWITNNENLVSKYEKLGYLIWILKAVGLSKKSPGLQPNAEYEYKDEEDSKESEKEIKRTDEIINELSQEVNSIQFIEIIENRANIRIGPSPSSTIIVQAKKGDIFGVNGETEEWYGIDMFSGEYRYVNKSMSAPATYTISLPSDSICQNVVNFLEEAEDRALDEANKKYPNSADIYKNIDYERLLIDRYKLTIFHDFNIQPPIYIKLIVRTIEGQ